ncbi:MAG: molecular chaperone DnaJ [Nanoarchaeota archaeon]|nr:molecular chaperone DnaJ [Nanoarchaeota archaeon]
MSKDYYTLLGVSKNAGKDEIKKAYKKLAMKYHPDRAPEDKKKEYEEKFKEINEAAAVLSDDKKRQQYDQFGSDSFQGGGGSSGFQGFDFSDVMSQFKSGGFGDFENIFDQLFGGREGRKNSSRKGNDLLYETEITLEDVAQGVEKNISLNKLEHCPQCHGKGALQFEQCHHCHGSGQIKRTQRTPFGIFQQTGPCPYCHGKGELAQDSCSDCGGEGVIRRKKNIDVSIPAGVEEGMRLRIMGEGEAGYNGGSSGNLYVLIHIADHPIFERENDNLHLTIPISFTQAVLGDEIEVPTIAGKAIVTIPPGTQSETVFRMREKGLPSLNSKNHGDQMVKVHLEVPTKLTKKQKELLLQLKEEKPSRSFLQRVFG